MYSDDPNIENLHFYVDKDYDEDFLYLSISCSIKKESFKRIRDLYLNYKNIFQFYLRMEIKNTNIFHYIEGPGGYNCDTHYKFLASVEEKNTPLLIEGLSSKDLENWSSRAKVNTKNFSIDFFEQKSLSDTEDEDSENINDVQDHFEQECSVPDRIKAELSKSLYRPLSIIKGLLICILIILLFNKF